jgi:hypothetical protein
MSSPTRVITPRLEAAIEEAVRWLDAACGMHQSTMRLAAWVHGNRPEDVPTHLTKLRAELLEAFEEARADQQEAAP